MELSELHRTQTLLHIISAKSKNPSKRSHWILHCLNSTTVPNVPTPACHEINNQLSDAPRGRTSLTCVFQHVGRGHGGSAEEERGLAAPLLTGAKQMPRKRNSPPKRTERHSTCEGCGHYLSQRGDNIPRNPSKESPIFKYKSAQVYPVCTKQKTRSS